MPKSDFSVSPVRQSLCTKILNLYLASNKDINSISPQISDICILRASKVLFLGLLRTTLVSIRLTSLGYISYSNLIDGFKVVSGPGSRGGVRWVCIEVNPSLCLCFCKIHGANQDYLSASFCFFLYSFETPHTSRDPQNSHISIKFL